MTYILNTTNLREPVIELIASIVIPKDTPPVNEIHLRNKEEGSTTGNWGKFYPKLYYITLCVPQIISNYSCIRQFTKKNAFHKDRYEFLAAILGHEYYHAYQWHHEQDVFHVEGYIEVGAERYEDIALGLWKRFKEETKWVEPIESRDQRVAATKHVRWKDYK